MQNTHIQIYHKTNVSGNISVLFEVDSYAEPIIKLVFNHHISEKPKAGQTLFNLFCM